MAGKLLRSSNSVIFAFLIAFSGAVSADPGQTQTSCSAVVKSCLTANNGTVMVYSYNGWDTSHTTPRNTTGPLSHGQSSSYFGCTYGVCDFKFVSSSGHVWWGYDVCGRPTLVCSPRDSTNCSVNATGPTCP